MNYLGELLKVKGWEINCCWNWGPDLSEIVIWKLCSSLEDSLLWMFMDIVSITKWLYLLYLLLLFAQNSLFLPSGTSFLWRTQCRISLQNSLFYLVIWNYSFSYCLDPCYLLFRFSPLPSFNSYSFATSTSGLYHINFLAVLRRTLYCLSWLNVCTCCSLSIPTPLL